MNAPNLPVLSESRPAPQLGHARGSLPSSLGGKMCGPRSSLIASSTSETRSSAVSAIAAVKSRQKSLEQIFPRDLAIGDLVELLFEIGGEVIFDIALEEAFEKRGDKPALVLGQKRGLLFAHIAAVLQRREDLRVGRGAADAELFELLDQRGFAVARRRLGEVLRWRDRERSWASSRRRAWAGARHLRRPPARRGLPGRV